MITLTINRGAGYNFVRWMWRSYHIAVEDHPVPDENKVVLNLPSWQIDLFREILIRRPEHFENAAGILKMLGHAN